MRFRSPDEPWPKMLLIGLTVAAVLVAAWPSVVSMVELWGLSSYGHAHLVPAISAWLLWEARAQIRRASVAPNFWAFLPLIALVWIWVVSRATFIQAGEHICVWLMLNTAVLAVVGWSGYRAAMPALFYLVFALPVGTSMVPALMEITADVSGTLLNVVGVPAYRAGMFFTLPGGNFEVAELCGGYRYLNAGLCIAALFALQMFRSPIKGALFVIASGAFFVLINGVRAALTMAIASATDMQWLADDHILFGWVLFLLGMIAIYVVATRLADKPRWVSA